QPNRVLRASAELAGAVVVSLEGDMETACEMAAHAGQLARECGWLKGEAVSEGNLAFFNYCRSDFAKAEEHLEAAEKSGYDTPSFNYAIDDTRISLAVARRDYVEADRLWQQAQSRIRGVAAWYRLRAAHIRVRALIQNNVLDDALMLATQSAEEATELQNEFFHWVFRLSIAE